jgi:hypothetical protein
MRFCKSLFVPRAMMPLLSVLLAILLSPVRSDTSLLVENALLRHQMIVLRRKFKGRVPQANVDRFLGSIIGFLRSLKPWS